MRCRREIERYVRTGDSDPHLSAWLGGFMEKAKAARAHLRGALVRQVGGTDRVRLEPFAAIEIELEALWPTVRTELETDGTGR